MGHSRNTEHVVCNCRGKAGRLENVLGPELGTWVLKVQSDQITGPPHVPQFTVPEKQKDEICLHYTQTRFPLKLMTLKHLGPLLVQASFKALDRVLELFSMVDFFFPNLQKKDILTIIHYDQYLFPF